MRIGVELIRVSPSSRRHATTKRSRGRATSPLTLGVLQSTAQVRTVWFVRRGSMATDVQRRGHQLLNGQCSPRQALDLIADRWTMIVVKALAEGNQRYGALHRDIGGISQKMLTQTLRSLERDGLVRRTVYPV